MNENACELGNSNNTSKGSIDDLTDTLSSASLSDPIQNNEADPVSSTNTYYPNLKPIQPIIIFPMHKKGSKMILLSSVLLK